jgi:DNA repair exonuclease SbcCD ATPase subunit
MKLRLINFRCYNDKTFDLGNGGLSLISGSSGLGKSTIFMAIYFALYGTGTKIISHGKTNCTVELEFDGMKIVRTKRPNRVVVNDTYEDDIAQNMINAKFGDCFNVTGYIAQNAIGSFVLMSPIEKLEFLEKFAFKDVDLGKIKGKCKALITKKHEALISVSSQLEMAQKILAEQEKPEEIKFPLKYPRSLYDKATKDQEIRHKNAMIHFKRSIKRIKTLNQELNALNILSATTQAKNENISFQRTKLFDLQKSKDLMTVCDNDEIEKHKTMLKSLIEHRRFSSLEESYRNDIQRLEDMKVKEISKLTTEIVQIESELWADFTPDEHTQTLKESEKFVRDFEMLDKLRNDMKKYENISHNDLEDARMRVEKTRCEYDALRKTIEIIKIQGEMYTCPCCKIKLRLKEKELCVFDESIEINTDLKSLLKQREEKEELIQKIERNISDMEIKLHRRDEITQSIDEITEQYKNTEENVSDIKSDINFLREYKNTQLRNEKRLLALKEELKNEKFSASYVSFRNNLCERENEIKRLKTYEIINENEILYTEDEFREKISTMESNFNKHKEICENITQLEKEISDCENDLENVRQEYIAKFEKIRDVIDVEQEVKKQEQEQQEQEQLIVKYQEILDQIKLFNEYENKQKIYDNWCSKVNELNKQEQEERKRYESALTLKEKILEAESRAILNIINSINMHTQIYLDCFFPDNPISITLMPFKETKKSVKPQINLVIDYKEMESLDIGSLSGGELARTILAFTLALGEMFNTPFLLLDEATASLDQDLTGIVMKGIRENFSGKLVITIAHQVVTGVFDRTICL